MLRARVVDARSKEHTDIEFFEDDTIDTIRQRIGVVANTHPDRLFVLVQCSRPKDYYSSDPRNWEALYHRLSYTSKSILQTPFELYLGQYRSPPLAEAIQYRPIGQEEWMAVPDTLKPLYEPSADFTELMIFGVSEHRSYILPLEPKNVPDISNISPTEYPIPSLTTLFSTMYSSILEFRYVREEEAAGDGLNIHFPFLRSTSPEKLAPESIRNLEKTTEKLKGIRDIPAPLPTHISFLRTLFRIPWVRTDFGDAVRSRFEQILYGQTVSKDVPYVGLFTGTDEIMRHKFFTEDPQTKRPFLNVTMWKSSWYNLSKPVRNRPTLLFYRGGSDTKLSSRRWDRIAITSTDMIVTSYHSEKELWAFKDPLKLIEDMKSELIEWFKQLDAVLPFVDSSDVEPSRWEFQDTSLMLKYDKKIEEYDLRKLPAVSLLFDVTDKTTSTFRLMRADVPPGSRDAKLLELLRQNPNVSVTELQDELDIPLNEAQLIRDDPDILRKAFRGFPTVQIEENTIKFLGTRKPRLGIEYVNALRYILTTDDESVGGRRMERVLSKKHTGGGDGDEEEDEYADMWGEAEADVEEVQKVQDQIEEVPEQIVDAAELVKVFRKSKTRHNYFNERLREYDPITFTSEKSEYPKKCEQDHQPIIMSDADLEEIDPEFDPRKWDKSLRLDIDGPEGKGYVICPEYWCMTDEIPLMEGQLKDMEDGFLRCPVCSGKVQKGKDGDPREFPVIARDKDFKFPGYLSKYKSPGNGKPLPCCYKIAEKTLEKKDVEDKYYILGETKDHLPTKRIALIPRRILQALYIPYTYDKLQGKARMLTGDQAFFRVGLGPVPSKVLPELLGLARAVPRPRDVPDLVLKCSFVSTWTALSDSEFESPKELEPRLKRVVAGIDEAFMEERLTPLQNLEYACIALGCDVFRVRMDTDTVSCMFSNRHIYARQRAIAVLQLNDDASDISILSHVTRVAKGLQFKAGLYSSKNNPTSEFKAETTTELEKLRNAACSATQPGFIDAFNAIRDIMNELNIECSAEQLSQDTEPDIVAGNVMKLKQCVSDFSVVLDPYGRGQALYIPNKVLLPYAPTPLPITKLDVPTVSGFDSVEPPSYDQARKYLILAEKYSAGFKWSEDVTNTKSERVEIMLVGGLRIPVQPQKVAKPNIKEVTETIREVGETELAFGPRDEDVQRTYQEISYTSEVFDFLLYTLSKDLNEKRPELKTALKTGDATQIQGPLREWFDDAVYQSNLDTPEAFLSKVRTPCGQFAKDECKGNLCGWDGAKCRIEVRKRLNKEALFARLLKTMATNAKMRAVVLDGRASPFFSTILYLELPHEVIVTDTELPTLQ